MAKSDQSISRKISQVRVINKDSCSVRTMYSVKSVLSSFIFLILISNHLSAQKLIPEYIHGWIKSIDTAFDFNVNMFYM